MVSFEFCEWCIFQLNTNVYIINTHTYGHGEMIWTITTDKYYNIASRARELSSFLDWWLESLFLSIMVPKYLNIFPHTNNGCSREKKFSAERFAHAISEHCRDLYNNPSYSRILIGSRLWSIRGQMHDWRHHYKVFPSAVLKWRKVLRIRIIFYAAGQKTRYKKVLPRHWTGSRSQKTKDKAVSFRKWYRNNFFATSVGSRARLNHAQTWFW